MLIVRSRSAAHALLDIVLCTVDDPRLPGIVESSLPASPEEPSLRRRQVERALEAVRAIRAACPEEPCRGMRVPIDVRDPPVHAALQAAEEIASDGVSVEVVDLRTLVPLDLATVLESVGKTKRLVVAHESVGFCGPGAEIAAAVGTELFGVLAAPVQRVAGTYTPVPRAATLEAACRPDATRLIEAVRRIV